MSRLSTVLLGCSLLLGACGGDGETNIITPAAEGGAGAPVGDPCGGVTTQSCFCEDGRNGSQSCAAGVWSECSCGPATTTAPVLTGNTDFTGEVDETGLCRAGHYTGEFYGEYWPGIGDPGALFGLPLGSLLMVNVSALPTDGKPGLALTLEKEEMTVSAGALDGMEFTTTTYSVKNGCVVGTAEAAGTQNPFVGVLTGELDCETGRFEGVLKGYYELLGFSELPFGFEGPVSGQYDPDKLAINDGQWMVEEESTAAAPPGGSGTWATAWTADVENAPPLPPECVEFLAGEIETTSSDEAAADAGAGTADAGVDGG